MTDEELKTIDNSVVFDSFIKARSVLGKHKKIAVSISGGADSDIVLDLIERVRTDENDVHYVWFNTGIEYQATKDHLVYLENRYGITIDRARAKKPIPVVCKEFGQPFLSKNVSNRIRMLQSRNFKFEGKPFEELVKEYPMSLTALRWWCNCADPSVPDGKKSMFNVDHDKWLKEFLIENPPTFKVSGECCKYAKKNPSKEYTKDNRIDLIILGIRKSEGGVRAAGKNCYTVHKGEVAKYRPIFWYTDSDKKWYEEHFDIVHSDCYTKYGLKRTGCVGCPFNSKWSEEQRLCEVYEPNLIKACRTIFKDSYEYTQKYKAFKQRMNAKEKALKWQTDIYDFIKEAN